MPLNQTKTGLDFKTTDPDPNLTLTLIYSPTVKKKEKGRRKTSTENAFYFVIYSFYS